MSDSLKADATVNTNASLLVQSFIDSERRASSDASVHFVVALSGGVDSAVVAKAARLSGLTCTAVTAESPSVSKLELQDAEAVARHVGIEHHFLPTAEIADSRYSRNDAKRCYYCKSHLLATIRSRYPSAIIVTGTNFDDLGDYRPGLEAAKEFEVFAPLAELEFGKSIVRELAEHWRLSIADKPASPCLASRLAYGVPVTQERLKRVEAAEAYLRQLGLLEFRVRLHPQELARIEVHEQDLELVMSSENRRQIVGKLMQLGFGFVTIDLAGFQSGSLNRLVQIQADSNSCS